MKIGDKVKILSGYYAPFMGTILRSVNLYEVGILMLRLQNKNREHSINGFPITKNISEEELEVVNEEK